MKTNPPEWAVRTKADRIALELGCYWDTAKANAIIKFAEKIYRSQFIHGPVKLRREQKELLQSIYGWRLHDGRRRFRFVTLHVPKKSFGKSLMLAVIGMFELLFSGEPSPVILAGAATRENAGDLYQEIKYSMEQNGYTESSGHIKYKDAQKYLKIKGLNAQLRCVSKWGKSNHGPNVSITLLDEAHVTEESLYKALRYAGRTRPNYMCLLASTAGDNTSHWYHDIYEKAKRVLAGTDEDITHFAYVYEADPKGDYLNDESQWYKANPNLGTPECPLDTFKAELVAAKNTGVASWLNFLQLNLNVWVKPSSFAWLDVTTWNTQEEELTDEYLQQFPCFGGLDGSQTIDPTSFTLTWELPNRNYYIRSKAWVCEDGLKKREQTPLPPYTQYPELEVTKGDMIHYPTVREYVLEQCQKFKVQKVLCDPTMVQVVLSELLEEGIECQRVPQTARWFDPAMQAFQVAWEEGRIKHGGSKWLRYCFENVRLEINKYGEIRPHRGRSADKIDGAVSTLLGFLGHVGAERAATSLGGFAS